MDTRHKKKATDTHAHTKHGHTKKGHPRRSQTQTHHGRTKNCKHKQNAVSVDTHTKILQKSTKIIVNTHMQENYEHSRANTLNESPNHGDTTYTQIAKIMDTH